MLNKKFDKYVDEVIIENSRFCCVVLFSKRLVLVSAYFPNDSNRKDQVSDEFLSLVDDLSCLFARFPNSSIVVGVDANVDFSRDNAHSKYFEVFCGYNDLSIARPSNATFKSGSIIDYFLVRGLCSVPPEVLSLSINPSDHNPLVVCLDFPFTVQPIMTSPKHKLTFTIND